LCWGRGGGERGSEPGFEGVEAVFGLFSGPPFIPVKMSVCNKEHSTKGVIEGDQSIRE
jgi:hypothetical protein